MSVTQEGYRNYLLARPMTANTVNSYCAGINHLARHCGLDLWSISDLELLDGLLADYDVAGELADIGNNGNGTARNALRQWRDYVASTAEEDGLSVESATQLFWLSLSDSERQWARWIEDKVTSLFPQADQWINKGLIWAVGVKPISAKKAISQVIRVARDPSKVLWCSVMQSGKPLFGITLEDKRGGSFYQANSLEDVTAWFDDTVLPHIESNQLNLDGQGNRPDDYALPDANTLTIGLTDGAIRNGYLRIPKTQSLIPDECIEFQQKPATRLFSISLPNGNVVETKVLAERGFLQARFNALFASAKLTEGDCVQLTRLASYSYEMQFLRQGDTQVKPNPIVLSSTQSLEPDMPLIPLNKILFGPPGTGKTYHTINKALAILDPAWLAEHKTDRQALKMRFDELVKEGRIDFVTFHQSFSYEDFVEGIRAVTGKESQLEYKVEAGVFKRICDEARASTVSISSGVRSKPRLWKISIDGTGTTESKSYCLNHGEARIGWGETGDLHALDESANSYYQSLGSNDRSTLRSFGQEIVVGDILICIRSAEQIEAIGVVTGDYRFETPGLVPDKVRSDYNHVRPVKWIYRDVGLSILPLNDDTRFTLKTVYPMDRFSWGDLLAYLQEHGVQPVETTQPPLKKQPYVLVIDEINRGNVSRIFGELITLIEPSKRAGAEEALSTTLPYSKRPFSVPDNLYLIGTMNTADRSLAGLDIALRRRFVFEEMAPNPSLLNGVVVETDGVRVDVARLLAVMNERIELLLDRDHCLGHAYFMPLKGNSMPTLAQLGTVFKTQILPLLQEYFFEDWQRIAWVLNDHRKGKADQLLQAPQVDIAALFGDQVKVGSHRQRWTLNEGAFARIGAYAGIIEVVAKGGHAEGPRAAAPEPAFEEEQVTQ